MQRVNTLNSTFSPVHMQATIPQIDPQSSRPKRKAPCERRRGGTGGQTWLTPASRYPSEQIVKNSKVWVSMLIATHCMSSEHFGQLAWQFKRMSGSSGLKVQAVIAC